MASFELVFASPFYRTIVEPLSLASEVKQYILANETESRRHPNSPQRNHAGVFESTFDFLTWEDPVVEKFRRAFFGYVGGFVKEANEFSDEEMQQINFDFHCWFHVTRNGGYFQPHNHPNASWSAIYCVDPGDEPTEADSSNSGHLMFQDPRLAGMHVDAGNRRLARPLSFNALRFRPSEGELIIFPSYLMHNVEPYVGERPRITVAANFWFTSNWIQ